MKKIVQIIGIITFFILVSYALTYPYELAYKGTEDIKLIEESYEFTSLEQIIKRSEYKNNVLYIRVWEPLEQEFYNYSLKEQEKQRDSLIKIIEADTLNSKVKTSEVKNAKLYLSGKIARPKDVISFEQELQHFSEMQEHYKNKDIVFVFLTRPNSEFETKEDDLRKWKAIIKKYKIKGHHFIMSQKLRYKLIARIKTIKGINMFVFPHNFIVDMQGNIANNNAASPSFEKEKVYNNRKHIILIIVYKPYN